MTSRALRGAAAALTLTLTLTHAGTASSQEGGFGGTMVVTYKDDISTFDPAIGYDWQNWSMIKSLFDGLMDYKPGTTELIPDLAESYTISDDGLTYMFKLRKGVKFHNGAVRRQAGSPGRQHGHQQGARRAHRQRPWRGGEPAAAARHARL